MTGDADWASSGLAFLTGERDGPPDTSPARVLDAARRVCGRITALTARFGHSAVPDPVEILTGRAALLGFGRRGTVSAGGATRLVRARDGWIALTLSRPTDIDSLPALLESAVPHDYWPAVVDYVQSAHTATVLGRAHLLGIPASRLGEAAAREPVVVRRGSRCARATLDGLLVVDLSSMWAGPLCGRLFADAGATVVKVEGSTRPDGARRGNARFFELLNASKLSVTCDFDGDTAAVAALLDRADVVIEASRPRALHARGLAAEQRPARDGQVWVRITGYGTDQSSRVAFGDDAAVAGGLVGGTPDSPVFCADAIADPLTGLESTIAALESLARGGGETIDIAMSAVAAQYAVQITAAPARNDQVHRRGDAWFLGSEPVRAPAVPQPLVLARPAPRLGEHNHCVHTIVQERTRC